LVAGLAGQAGVLAEGGVEDRDRFGQRQGQVEEQRALPGQAAGFDPQLVPAFGGGVRLGGQQRAQPVTAMSPMGRRCASDWPARKNQITALRLLPDRSRRRWQSSCMVTRPRQPP